MRSPPCPPRRPARRPSCPALWLGGAALALSLGGGRVLLAQNGPRPVPPPPILPTNADPASGGAPATAAAAERLARERAARGGSARVYPIDPETAPRPAARAVRTPRPITVDGRLDEAEWALAEPLGEFVQQLPHTGMPAVYPTEVRILYDAENLYVAALNHDPHPERAITSGLERDFVSSNSDAFGIALDTFHDRRNSFLFIVNPKGAVRDEQTFNDSRTIVDAWEGIIQVRTAEQDSSWTVEMAIPLRTLRFDARLPMQTWGLNLIRRVRRVNETSYWAPLERQYRVHRMSQAGTLEGLEGLAQGRNLLIKPYALTGSSQGAQVPASARGTNADLGGDLKYGVTPSLTLDLTANTDFSQVEVDQEQVNLTRFSLFFPERREFFIENSGVFTFGDVTERNYRMGSSLGDFTFFNSRQIGLSRDGRPLPILGGGRLTGRVGGWEVGLLDMRTRGVTAQPGENFAVARVRRNVLGNSDVGVLLQSRDAAGGAYNRAWGVDANLRPRGNLIVNSYLASSEAAGEGSDGHAARTTVAYRGRLWNTSAMWKRVSDSFDPGLGFVRRRGMQQWYGTAGVHARPRWARVQELVPYVEADYIGDLASQLDTRSLSAGLEVHFQPDGLLTMEVSDQFDRLETPFTIFPGQRIPVGPYGWREGRIEYQSGQGRPVYGTVRLAGGEFYDGTRRTVGGSLTWRPRYDLVLETGLQRNDVARPGGGFVADLASLRLRYARSTRLFGSAFVQYNTQARAFVTNARVNFRYRPLSDVFLVYTERRNTDGGARDPRWGLVNERSVALKVTRMLAF